MDDMNNTVSGSENNSVNSSENNSVNSSANGSVNSSANSNVNSTANGNMNGGRSAGNSTPGDTPRDGSSITYSWVNPKLREDAGQNAGSYADRHSANAGPTNFGNSYAGQNYANNGAPQYRNYNYHYQAGQGYGNAGQQPAPNGPVKRKKSTGRNSGARKWAAVIAMAVVFGLIAGSVTYGVNLAANRIHPIEASEAQADSQDGQEDHTGSSMQQSVSSGSEEIAGTGDANSSGNAAAAGSAEEASGTTGVISTVTKNVMPSLVTISTISVEEMQNIFGGSTQQTVAGAGTGVIIAQNDSELLIATNNHVVQGATTVSVGFIDEAVVSAAIKGTDPSTDLAILAVELDNIDEQTKGEIKIAAIGDSDELKLGDTVIAIGNALGYGQSVTSGIVSALNRNLTLNDGVQTFNSTGLIQTDAAINSGNSGGGLFNAEGELIGINEAKSSMSSNGATVDNVGYAIPMAKAQPILEELMSHETRKTYSEDEQGYLGVTIIEVTSELAQMYSMPEGVALKSITSSGPADKAGLAVGDVIVALGDAQITSYSDLQTELRYHAAGETVTITYQRAVNGTYEEQTTEITLGSKADLQG